MKKPPTALRQSAGLVSENLATELIAGSPDEVHGCYEKIYDDVYHFMCPSFVIAAVLAARRPSLRRAEEGP